MKNGDRNIIDINNLNIGYGKRVIVSDINEHIDTPCVVSLIGPNGAGKSTLLKTLTKELPNLSGNILINGKPLAEYSRKEFAHNVSLVSTEIETTAGGLKVKELIGLGRYPHTGFFGRLNKEDIEIIDESMQSVGIQDKQNRFVADLSDGERQKAMIARALAQQTAILFLDEPFSFLDPVARIEIFLTLKKEAHCKGKLIILSTHEVTQALQMSDRIWAIGSGEFHSFNVKDTNDLDLINSLYPSNEVEFNPHTLEFIPK